MAVYRERDPFLEVFRHEQEALLASIAKLASEEGRRGLDEVDSKLRALEAAEAQVLYPAGARVALRPETQRLIDDCRGNRAEQQHLLQTLVRTRRTHPLCKLRMLQLRELVQHHAEMLEAGLIPVLRSQLPRALYASLASAFAARTADAQRERSSRRVAAAVSRAAV